MNRGLHVEKGDASTRSGALEAMEEIERECSVSCADFENGLRWTGQSGDGAREVSLVAHPPVQALQIAAGAERFRVICGELVENLRLYNAVHWSPANIEKRAVATDSRAERGKEPSAAGRFCREGFLKSENDTGTANDAVFAQDLGAPIQFFSGYLQAGLQRGEDVAPARMNDPFLNVFLGEMGRIEQTIEDLADVFNHEERHAFIEDVAQHAIAGFEAEKFAVAGVQNGFKRAPFDARKIFGRFFANDDRASAIAEQTGADENAGIVIKVEGGAADFDADAEDAICLAGGDKGVGELEIGKSGTAAVANRVREVDARPEAELFADVAG